MSGNAPVTPVAELDARYPTLVARPEAATEAAGAGQGTEGAVAA